MATINVSSAAGLNAALAAASGGDIIELAAGSYGHVNISGLNTAAGVTIRSADSNARADLASLYITSSSNLTIEDVLVDFVPDQSTALWSPAVDIRNSDSITIKNTEIDGGKAVNNLNGNVQGYYTGMGIQAIQGTTNLKVISSDIHGFDKGIRLDVDGLVVKNSEIHHTRSTPLGGTFSNAVIDGNHLHDIFPFNYGGAGDHGDFIKIQRLGGGASPLSNITITNNFFDQGKGHPILGILFDSSGNPTGFANVDISDNVFFNANALGMSLGNVHNSRIANNTLLDSRGDDLDQPGIYLSGGNSNIAIIDNIAGYVSAGGGTGITEQGTLLVQRTNPYGANFYGDLFVNALSLLPDIEDLRARPGGPLDGTGLGAALTHFDPSPQKLTAQILPVRDGAGLFLFDGRLSADKSGYLDAQNATFSWDFGNGKTGAGDSAVVSYDTPGFYKVVLSVSHGGKTDKSTSWVEVVDPLLLQLNGDGGAIADGSSYGVPITRSVGVSLADGPWGKALRMGTSSELRFDRHQADQMFNLDGFQLAFDLKLDGGSGSAGRILTFYTAWYVEVTASGELLVNFINQTGQTFQISTAGAGLTDGAWHDLKLDFDRAAQKMSILVDGQKMGEGAMSGQSQPIEYWNPGLGNYYANGFSGLIDNFEISSPNPSVRLADFNSLFGPGNPPQVIGSAQDDTIQASNFDDLIDAGNGNNLVTAKQGADVVQTGSGNDIVYANAGNDRVKGGGGNDRLHGADGNDWLSGQSGNDRIIGGTGTDTIFGGTGDDSILGGYGTDRIYAGDGINSVSGGYGDDTVFGGIDSDRIQANRGNDRVEAGDGADWLAGGRHDDLLFGGRGNDTVRGSYGDDRLYGEGGDDTLNGGYGDDYLSGGSGNDRLQANGGHDTLKGGTGDDLLVLGKGQKTLIVGDGHGHDKVIGFKPALAQIDMTATALTGFADLTLTNGPQGVTVDYGTGSLLLQGLHVGDLSPGDFLFG